MRRTILNYQRIVKISSCSYIELLQAMYHYTIMEHVEQLKTGLVLRMKPMLRKNMVERLPMNTGIHMYCTSCEKVNTKTLDLTMTNIETIEGLQHHPFTFDVMYDDTVYLYHLIIRIAVTH
jgi:hypothetical protein